MNIIYYDGDATEPVGEGAKIIAHVCNDIGGWGRGFVLAVSKKWPEPEAEYRKWAARAKQCLGEVQFVGVAPGLCVANMIGQTGIHPKDGIPPIRYIALRQCLKIVRLHAVEHRESVHMPRIGSRLAGGNWEMIEKIITQELRDIPVYVYNYHDTASPSYIP